MVRVSALQRQCAAIGWQLTAQVASPASDEVGWLAESGEVLGPEDLVLERLCAAGATGSWCEGGSINLLMKAASLEILAKHNTFFDRSDAVTRYFEAQCTILKPIESQILCAIVQSDRSAICNCAAEICSNAFIRATYPRVTPAFIALLWGALGRNLLLAIAKKFFEKPYDYRAGWPDLTLIDDSGVRFVEVKTKDHLHASQMRFAQEVAAPLGLRCSVVHVRRQVLR